MMQIRTMCFFVVTAAAVSACSSPKDASDANFAAAINAHYKQHCSTLDFSTGTRLLANFEDNRRFPVGVANAAEAANPELVGAPFKALEKAGLLTSAGAQVQGLFGTKSPGKTYSLTRAGNLATSAPGQPSFCIGHRTVDQVLRFSQPTSAMGPAVSRVEYVYTLADVPAWAKDPGVQAAFPELAAMLAPGVEAKVDVELMSDGWAARPLSF